jgi:hypothetical protein
MIEPKYQIYKKPSLQKVTPPSCVSRLKTKILKQSINFYPTFENIPFARQWLNIHLLAFAGKLLPRNLFMKLLLFKQRLTNDIVGLAIILGLASEAPRPTLIEQHNTQWCERSFKCYPRMIAM